ncbi:DUF2059 domain-containing protein [Flavobacterium aquicola]|uniref:DUF2059 domain-containing protein n=1 Tax=Flavobacterium aquicola TaxID=1682742 RepID=A0A3E0ELT4_9FLAO|nr:DUF2059 domain-containing protein [Flavobacterium aquicola]REG98096.1 hypothetical protein C8P67_10718 [Flavobacterium aquicola]
MKKTLLIFALVLTAQFVTAQDAAFKAEVLKFITISGGDAQIKTVKNQVVKMIAADKQSEFLKDFDATLPSLYDKLAKVYMEVYSPADIKAMIAFYESPIGLKMQSKSVELSEKSLIAGQEWGQEFAAIMLKYQ